MHLWWEVIKTIYWSGLAVAALFTLLVSRDSIRIRLLTSGIIGLTWPFSLPVVLLFSLF
ncbi:GhoT/OrtT family toxin [Rouxiella sp. Mn2063]|uniref:GhoT/OrtT family toxin n=1 Tax=Rouxiella sp. Mn2063 TaxID=3395262 RepID=UPI003BEC4B34